MVSVLVFKKHKKQKEKTEKKPPSTPYEHLAHIYKHSKLALTVCIVSVISLIPLLALMQDVEVIQISESMETTLTSNSPMIMRIIFLGYTISIFAFYYASVKIRKVMQTPVMRLYRQFRDETLLVDNNITDSQILNDIAEKLELEVKPRLLLTQEDIPHIFGKREQETILVMSKKDFGSLEQDELEATLTHELWHAKSDIQIRFLEQIEIDPILVYYFAIVLLWVEGFFGLVQLAFATSTIAWPFRILISEWYPVPTPFLANPVMFALSAIPHLFSCLVVVSGLSLGLGLLKYAAFSFEQEEYYTDAMTLLTTKELIPLVCGIRRDEKGLRSCNRKFIKEYYISSEEFSMNLSEYQRMLEPAIRKKISGSAYSNKRIKQAILINKLISGYTSLRVRRKMMSFSSFSFFGLKFKLYFSPYARALDNVEKDIAKKIYEYIILHGEKFNLPECAESTESRLTDTFTVFVCLLMAGVIE